MQAWEEEHGWRAGLGGAVRHWKSSSGKRKPTGFVCWFQGFPWGRRLTSSEAKLLGGGDGVMDCCGRITVEGMLAGLLMGIAGAACAAGNWGWLISLTIYPQWAPKQAGRPLLLPAWCRLYQGRAQGLACPGDVHAHARAHTSVQHLHTHIHMHACTPILFARPKQGTALLCATGLDGPGGAHAHQRFLVQTVLGHCPAHRRARMHRGRCMAACPQAFTSLGQRQACACKGCCMASYLWALAPLAGA